MATSVTGSGSSSNTTRSRRDGRQLHLRAPVEVAVGSDHRLHRDGFHDDGRALGWLRPDQHPVFVLLPVPAYTKLRAAWELPRIDGR